ncbi:class I SAM-dependent methyltransferase [Thioalkalivibrio sp. ALE9]|uniref:class I SAM-dependent methyltransferase n=1 Tax=Thioalkalivibrio sp. ALE9 TaxID=1158169 RepID=UPI0003631A75|nr:class I SAM-dependent methyltransferase [Thioalkalivibrio sp. ALE9]
MVTGLGSDALLGQSSRWSGQLAEQVCGSGLGEGSCADFHAPWQVLRKLGLAAGPERHETFFRTELARQAVAGNRRVLIAGSADFGMLEIVHRAFGGHLLEPTVVDLCATPLMLCAWYGAMTGLPVRTVLGDLNEPDMGRAGASSALPEDEEFDLITTHSLLRYFDSTGRKRLLRNWYHRLRPGGAVVTVTRLTSSVSVVSETQASQFAECVLDAAREQGCEWSPEQLRDWAARFVRAGHFHPTGSVEEVRAVFEEAGLTVQRLDVRTLGGAVGASAAAPGTAQGAEYAEIVAVRP